ncbi:hypothetical protein DFJ74DRAFT_706206 [Hyaloraphidium curvatum]|nr:hypothetical protein DFJ74DRAFT_706206 [Hyaloraphidium curvatum]
MLQQPVFLLSGPNGASGSSTTRPAARMKRYPCQPFACAVQACLEANNFKDTERKCADAVRKLEECCLRERKVEGGQVVESEGCAGVLASRDKRDAKPS